MLDYHWRYFQNAMQLNRLGHAYLFTGPHGSGKFHFAKEFCSFLLCQEVNSKNGKSCKNCVACRQVAKLAHPDVFILTPLPTQQDIGINQLQQLSWYLNTKPYIGPRRIAIIPQAEKMTLAAQSAFLKTLEEPPGQSLFLLTSEYPGLLLPTIFSRAQLIRFVSFSASKYGNKRVEKRENSAAVKRAEALTMLLKADLITRFQYAAKMAELPSQELQMLLLAWLEAGSRQLRRHAQNHDFSKAQKLAKILSEIERIRYLLFTTNVNTRLALENLMFSLQA